MKLLRLYISSKGEIIKFWALLLQQNPKFLTVIAGKLWLWADFGIITHAMDKNMEWKLLCFDIANPTKITFLQNCTPHMLQQRNLSWLSLIIHGGIVTLSQAF